jgi:catechol 2,3-dioxygenase-like lactoylglutathione lyase family enzyme
MRIKEDFRMARLEHVNVTVADPDATAAMLGDLFGWRIRWRGPSIYGGTSVHVGEDATYLAVYGGPDMARPAGRSSYGTAGGMNHIGVVVDDLDAVEAKVKARGYDAHSHADYDPGRRFYFREENGIEIEVVCYS